MAKDVSAREGASPAGDLGRKNGRPAPDAPLQGTSIDDLGTRLAAIDGVNEDMATFLAHNWQRFFGALCVVLLGVVLYHQYRGTQDARRAEAAQRFEEARRQFARVISPETSAEGSEPAKDDATQTATLLEQLRSLESSQANTFYGKTAPLYRAQAFIEEGKPADAEAALQSYGWKSFQNIAAAKKSADVAGNALENELAALLEARALVSKGDPTETLKARSLLGGLVLGGRFLNLEALIALYRISDSPEHRTEAEKKAAELLAARPELSQTFQTHLAGAGIALKELP